MHTESSLCAKLQSWSEDIEAYKNKNKNKKPTILKLHVSVNKHLRFFFFFFLNPLEKCYTKPPCGHVKWDYLYNFLLFFLINIQLSTWKLNAQIIIIIVRDILAH